MKNLNQPLMDSLSKKDAKPRRLISKNNTGVKLQMRVMNQYAKHGSDTKKHSLPNRGSSSSDIHNQTEETIGDLEGFDPDFDYNYYGKAISHKGNPRFDADDNVKRSAYGDLDHEDDCLNRTEHLKVEDYHDQTSS
jgi:hypothetical protein